MYQLQPNPILKPHQIAILRDFFASPVTHSFFLTGGTALAAFYFAHRDSKDFDFFSIEEFNQNALMNMFEHIASNQKATITVKVNTPTYKEIYLENTPDHWTQRIDIVREQPRHFGTIVSVENVRVDSLENIGSNKILTLFGRLEPKDYIDFYTIITKTKLAFDELFVLAQQKDLGLHEFHFAQSIAAIDQITKWPEMKIPISIPEITAYYQNLSTQLLRRIKPKV